MPLRRRKSEPPAAVPPGEADRQLAEARQLQELTIAQQPLVDKITADAERHVRSNNMAMLIRRALQQHGGHA